MTTQLAHEFNNKSEQLAWQATNEIWHELMERKGFDQVVTYHGASPMAFERSYRLPGG